MTRPTIAEAARFYTENGLAVYGADTCKVPLFQKWNFEAAIRDPDRAHRYFEDNPQASIGIANGPSNVVVVDSDPRNGGHASLYKLRNILGIDILAGAPVVVTPGGGQHFFFRQPKEPLKSGTHILGAGLDVIGDGGGVIAPPSFRDDRSYAWFPAFPEKFDPPELPAILAERIRSKAVARMERKIKEKLPAVIHGGDRNDALTSLGGRLKKLAGFGEREILAALLATNGERCKPPLPSKEIETIAHSVASYPASTNAIAWLEHWQPRLTHGQLQIAVVFMTIYELHCGATLTPAAELIRQRTGVEPANYYRYRKALEDLGAIRVLHRGRMLAPIIELLFNDAA